MSESAQRGPRVVIDLEALPGIAYDLVHTGRPFIRHLGARSAGAATEADVTVSVKVTDGDSVIAGPWEREFPLIPHSGINIEPELELDPAFMRGVEERRPVQLSVQVSAGDVALGAASRQLTLYAHNQWALVDGAGSLTMSLLAAHVQPNDPEIAEVLTQAREILRRHTGSAATQGYQAGPERATEIAQAVYQAIVARGFDYSDPPASWADPLQKIRTHAQVFTDRAATCLDSAVLYAAALEAAGLLPTIWLPPGHALVGVWLVEDSLPDSAIVDPTLTSMALNLVDSGRMLMVETTVMAERANFGAARQAGNSAVNTTRTPIDAVVDVRAARIRGITPLPVARTAPDGSVELHTYQAGTISVAKAQRPEGSSGSRASDVPLKVRMWKSALLDLSLRNQLINFRDTATSISLLLPPSSEQIHPLDFIEDELHAGQSFALVPADGSDEFDGLRGAGAVLNQREQETLAKLLVSTRSALVRVDSERYVTRLRKLRYASRTSVQESGSNNLYLTLGSLVWRAGDKDLKSPLILVPVTLEGGTRGTPFRMVLDESGTSTPNYCLLEKLKVEHGLLLPELEVPLEDGYGVAVEQIFDKVRNALADAELPYRVDETAQLAILQFAKFRLWKDLDDHWERFAQNRLVRHLVHSRTEYFEDEPAIATTETSLDDLAAASPIPADATQLHAIRSAVDGETFVLEGPPGTGKSQTITNLLARAIAEGRKVLFVAEKRAALDVVQSRLESVGLGPFCLDLHDKGSKPTKVRQQLLESLHHEPLRDPAGVEAAQGQLRAAVTILSRYRDRLHEPNGIGVSLYGAHERILAMTADAPDEELIQVDPEEVAALTEDQWTTLRPRLLDFGQALDAADAELDGPWTLARGVDFDAVERIELAATVRRLFVSLDLAQASVAGTHALELLLAGGKLVEFERFAGAAPPPLHTLDAMASGEWSARVHRLLDDLTSQMADSALAGVTPALWTLPLEGLHQQSVAVDSSGVFGRKKRRLAVLDQLRPGLRGPESEPAPKQLTERLMALVAARRQLKAALEALDAMPGLAGAGQVNPLDEASLSGLRNRVGWNEWLASAVARESPERPLLRAYAHDGGQPQAAVMAAESFIADWAQVREALAVDDQSLERWASTRTVPEALNDGRLAWMADSENGRFRRLAVWLGAAAVLDEFRSSGLSSLSGAALSRSVDPLHLEEAVTLAVMRASLRERAAAGRLDAFHADAHDRSVERFARSSALLRTRMTEEIPADLIRARPFNARSLVGEVGALQRELNKERRGLPIRALLNRYGHVIAELTPCFLVSPDSAARFLEPGAIDFDLVVFDEASQIRVAEAIGAMGRGRAVVVVGDSRQMPPSTFGGGSAEDEEDVSLEEESSADEESILSECVQARVRREWLSWHYRSRDETLIAFSNGKYYEGKLSSFPAPRRAGSGPSVTHVFVPDGHFFRTGDKRTLRTNPREAQQVVAGIVAKFRRDPNASVGVVTFNVQQRDLIINLLSNCGEEAVVASVEADDDDSLFVKNLENVQGDERDSIIFSLAFSKNEKGVLPLNFGPLNRDGGERRLNVAVTRARNDVQVYSSFLPGDMRIDSTESRGVRHLHDYLDMAVRGVDDLAQRLGRTPTPEDRHRDAVAAGLRARGWPVRTDVGLSGFRIDLVVGRRDSGEGDLAAILLDGPGWSDRPTVGDRDGLPVDVLTGLMGWPLVTRVWLPTWLDDEGAVLDRLEMEFSETAEQIPANEGADSANRVPRSAPAPQSEERHHELSEFEMAVLGAHPIDVPQVMPDLNPEPSPAARGDSDFVAWDPPYLHLSSLDAGDPEEWSRLTAAMREGIDQEGPIHVQRLVRLIANALGIRRLTAERNADLLRAVPKDRQRTQGGQILWPAGVDASGYVAYRVTGSDDRLLAHVPAIEIGNAMVPPVERAMGIERAELLRVTMRAFGAARLTTAVGALLEAGLVDALDRGRLAERDDLIVRGEKS